MKLPDDTAAFALTGILGSNREFRRISGDADSGRFEKDMIAIGRYTHPVRGWVLNVDGAMLDSLESNFKAMDDAGIKVPVTLDHGKKSEHVRGQLVGVRREGDRLIGVHDIIGKDAVAMTDQPAVETSLEIDENYHTTKDRHAIGPAIVASSMVQRPVCTGQTPFVKIAASRANGSDEVDAPVLIFGETTNEAKEMKDLIAKLNKTFSLSIVEDASAEDVAKILNDAMAASVKEASTAATAAAATADVKELTTQVTDLTAKLNARPAAVELSAVERKLSAKCLGTELEALVKAGRITPDVAKKLLPILSTDKMLSIGEGKDDADYEGIISVLKDNDPVKLGEVTNLQNSKEFSIDNDGDINNDELDPDLQKRSDAAFGVQPVAAK